MKTIIKSALPALLLFCSTVLQAQQDVEMADKMRSEGKIYVVVVIVLLVLVGLFAYLVRIDRKITRLEDQMPPKKL